MDYRMANRSDLELFLSNRIEFVTSIREIENITGGAFWEWLARINKLRQELELCRQS